MRTIAIISQKGGSGKTTLAVHLAVCAERNGQRTALIDLDPQGSAAGWSARRDTEGPDVVKATTAQLAALLAHASEGGADLVIIDTAPHSDSAAAIAAQSADMVLIPCRPSTFDIDAIGSTLEITKLAKASAAVVLNAVPPRGTLAAEAREGLKEQVTVAPVEMHQRAAYSHAVIDGRSVQEFEPTGQASKEIEHLYEWIFNVLPSKR